MLRAARSLFRRIVGSKRELSAEAAPTSDHRNNKKQKVSADRAVGVDTHSVELAAIGEVDVKVFANEIRPAVIRLLGCKNVVCAHAPCDWAYVFDSMVAANIRSKERLESFREEFRGTQIATPALGMRGGMSAHAPAAALKWVLGIHQAYAYSTQMRQWLEYIVTRLMCERPIELLEAAASLPDHFRYHTSILGLMFRNGVDLYMRNDFPPEHDFNAGLNQFSRALHLHLSDLNSSVLTVSLFKVLMMVQNAYDDKGLKWFAWLCTAEVTGQDGALCNVFHPHLDEEIGQIGATYAAQCRGYIDDARKRILLYRSESVNAAADSLGSAGVCNDVLNIIAKFLF